MILGGPIWETFFFAETNPSIFPVSTNAPEERQFGRNFLASELRLREDDRSRKGSRWAQQGDLQFFFPQKVSNPWFGI